MARRYILGYDGQWQESFDGPEAAISRAEEVAETGAVVEIVSRRFGLHSFYTAFPASERDALKARWRVLAWSPWGGSDGSAGGGTGHHYNGVGAHGGGHGGGHHGGGGHGGH